MVFVESKNIIDTSLKIQDVDILHQDLVFRISYPLPASMLFILLNIALIRKKSFWPLLHICKGKFYIPFFVKDLPLAKRAFVHIYHCHFNGSKVRNWISLICISDILLRVNKIELQIGWRRITKIDCLFFHDKGSVLAYIGRLSIYFNYTSC